SVETVYAELAQSARSGQTFVDHATVSPGLNQRCAEQLKARGADFLDAPVSGGPAGAQAGTLTVMVGGQQAVFDRALPVLQAFGKNIRLCGPVGAVPLLLGALAEQRFSEARARGLGEEDMAALVKLWEEPAGVTISPSSAS